MEAKFMCGGFREDTKNIYTEGCEQQDICSRRSKSKVVTIPRSSWDVTRIPPQLGFTIYCSLWSVTDGNLIHLVYRSSRGHLECHSCMAHLLKEIPKVLWIRSLRKIKEKLAIEVISNPGLLLWERTFAACTQYSSSDSQHLGIAWQHLTEDSAMINRPVVKMKPRIESVYGKNVQSNLLCEIPPDCQL